MESRNPKASDVLAVLAAALSGILAMLAFDDGLIGGAVFFGLIAIVLAIYDR